METLQAMLTSNLGHMLLKGLADGCILLSRIFIGLCSQCFEAEAILRVGQGWKGNQTTQVALSDQGIYQKYCYNS